MSIVKVPLVGRIGLEPFFNLPYVFDVCRVIEIVI